MINDTRTCQEPDCPGHMERTRTLPAGPYVAGDATSHVDLFKCDTCGAEDWE